MSTEPKVKHVAIRPVADTWPSRRRGAECPIWFYRPPPGPKPVCGSEARRGVPQYVAAIDGPAPMVA